jgi:hypothetical protein
VSQVRHLGVHLWGTPTFHGPFGPILFFAVLNSLRKLFSGFLTLIPFGRTATANWQYGIGQDILLSSLIRECWEMHDRPDLRSNLPVEQASANARFYLNICPTYFAVGLATARGA